VALSGPSCAYYDAGADGKAQGAYYGRLLADVSPPAGFTLKLGHLVRKSHVHQLGYFPDKYLYNSVDRHPDGTLRDIYSGAVLDPPRRAGVGGGLESAVARQALGLANPHADPVALALQPLPAYNCEHVVPRAWFGDRQPMRGDLHHLFTSDTLRNRARGDRSLLDDPPPCGRGEAARATLYFLLRYPHQVDRISPADVETLKRWSRENPPDDHERHRNVEIQKLQGNRNPFVDHPEWAERVAL
jgi:endonuclease I